jgi:hypothetical protein
MVYPNGRIVRYEYNSGLDDAISRLSFLADDNGGMIGTHLEEVQLPRSEHSCEARPSRAGD